MRYILDDNGYIESVSCTPFFCNDKGCTEYTGKVPDGYLSLDEWATTANIKAYKVVDGQLVYDSAKDTELQAEWNNTINGIVESGSNDKGTYIKYVDGTMIQRGSVYTYVNINVADGVLYRPAGEIGLYFPQNFIDNTYQVNFTASRDIIGGYAISKYVDVAWVWCFAPSSRGATGRYLDYIAIGKWK